MHLTTLLVQNQNNKVTKNMKKQVEEVAAINKILNSNGEILLSKHFTYNEMVRSDTATRNKIWNFPNAEHYLNLEALCNDVLEPIRAKYKRPWNRCYIPINSGYRSFTLNKLVGGSSPSQHRRGEAADFTVKNTEIRKVWNWIVLDSGIDFDQCIFEFGSWIHISYKRNGKNRNKITVATNNKNGKTQYKHYSKEDVLNGSVTFL